MDNAEHGAARAGLITASVAKIIMSGGEQAWDTLIKNLWADDGSDFAKSTGGAREHGHTYEPVGRSMFWERHPSFDVDEPKFLPFTRRGFATNHPYRQMLAFSPDAGVLDAKSGERLGGVEIKSPADEGVFKTYVAYCARAMVPPEHVDQVYFSLWASGWRRWYFVTHFDGQYAETVYGQDELMASNWVDRFRPKLDAFIKLYREGVRSERDKLAASSLASLLRT